MVLDELDDVVVLVVVSDVVVVTDDVSSGSSVSDAAGVSGERAIAIASATKAAKKCPTPSAAEKLRPIKRGFKAG